MQLGEWTYERSELATQGKWETFSIGVFQWLPKSGGKGLKKSKTIRVTGYTVDAKAVYAKADDLCQKLNAEKASSDIPPSWLQKSYAVDKPTGYKPARVTLHLTGQQARLIRQRTMKKTLVPLGFVQTHASTYVRPLKELFQVINFQTRMWGGGFTVNLGLHPAFVPMLGKIQKRPWKSIDHLNCSLQGRLGFFLAQKRDTWFQFGEDPDRLEQTFKSVAEQGVVILDKISVSFEDLEKVQRKGRKGLLPFEIHYPRIFWASIEIRLGQFEAARSRLNEPLLPEHQKIYHPLHQQLLAHLQMIERVNPRQAKGASLLSWFTNDNKRDHYSRLPKP